MIYHNNQQYIQICMECMTACNHCAIMCTKEEYAKDMAMCIQLDMECALICYTASQLFVLNSDAIKAYCLLCAEACERCADECNKHDRGHCRECAVICLQCAEVCKNVAA